MTPQDLQRRAARKLRSIRSRRADPRYARVLGRLVAERLLTTNEAIEPHRDPIRVADALWVGQVEPRVIELLPALLVRHPSMFADPKSLPEDLAQVVRRLRRNLVPPSFRGIDGERLYRWLPEVGRTHKVPSRLKSFRFTEADLRILKALSVELQVSETEVLRRGLRALL